MKKLLILIGFAAMLGIFSCGSGEVSDPKGPSPKVTVTGNVYNQAVLAAQDVPVGQRELSGAIAPYSILNAACSGLELNQLPGVIQGKTITVEWTIENLTAESLQDIQYNVEFENTAALHRETWSCLKWYDNLTGDGSRGLTIWKQSGGYFYNAIATPALPACESPMVPAGDSCDPKEYDCANPWWGIDYNASSSGCVESIGFVSIGAYLSTTGADGYTHSNIDIRPGHLARFQALQDGKVLDEKCYVFEVTP